MTHQHVEQPPPLPAVPLPAKHTEDRTGQAAAAEPAAKNKESDSSAELPPERLAGKIQSLRAAVWILAALAAVGMLYWARSFFIPLCFGIVLAYTLRPTVDRLARAGIPRALSAFVICLGLISATGYAIYTLRDDATELLEQLPQAVKKVRVSMQNAQDKPRTLLRMREAAHELDRAAAEVSGQSTGPARPATPSASVADKVQSFALQQGVGLAELTVQLFFSLLLAFYLLSEGDAFKRRLLKLVGPSLARKKITVRILDDINLQIQRYMVSILVVNSLIGIAVGVSFYLMGVNFSLLWGVAAGALHFLPYVGQAILMIGSGLAAYLQFGTIGSVLLVVLVTVLSSVLIGLLFMNWLQSRLARINPAFFFVAIMFFGWLWGAWGLVLACPIVAIFKSLCDHIEPLQPCGEFMSRGRPVDRNGE
jgi:predicted PurR-regulated permease PerM